MPVPAATPAVINGVALLTRSGKPKSRFSEAERLQLLGATKRDLRDFIALFCPDRPLYAVTRRNSCDPRAWTTPRRRLNPAEVLRHLTADLTPGLNPMWVAPRCWEITRWVGLDVDYRGDREDFVRRCRQVLEALSLLGVHRRAILRSPTPSGGRHYRFFLNRKVRVRDVPQILALVGIVEAPGQIEIFPKQTNGMRLPFGLMPGRKYSARPWLRFIRAYRHKKFPLVEWFRLRRRAQKFAEDVFYGRAEPIVIATKPTPAKPKRDNLELRPSRQPIRLGIPKKIQAETIASTAEVARYLELLSTPVKEPSDVDELWNLGIRSPGTRISASKRIAWNLLVVHRLSTAEATARLVKWVYETGRTTSIDVGADLRRGTRKVEKETENLVGWMATHHPHQAPPDADKRCISKSEIDIIRDRLGNKTHDSALVCVALNFLRFAKLNGIATPDGWCVQVAVNGVIRRWPGCRGMGYKPLIDALKECGFVRMTREKKQSADGTGRPRTYLVCVPPDLRLGATLAVEEATAIALQRAEKNAPADMNALRIEKLSDTYKRSTPPTPTGELREHERVVQQDSRNVGISMALPFGQGRGRVFAGVVEKVCENAAAFGRRDRSLSRDEMGVVRPHRPPPLDANAFRLAERSRRLCRALCRKRHFWLRQGLRPPPPIRVAHERRHES